MPVAKRRAANVFLDTVLKNFYAATEEMNLDDGLVEILSRSERKTCVCLPVELDDGTIRVFDGFRVAHSTVLGPAKGASASTVTSASTSARPWPS